MKKNYSLIFFIALLFNTVVYAGHLTPGLTFSAWLSGDQEVPAVTTDAIGLATFKLSPNMDSLCVSATVSGLSGTITGAHIHEGDTSVAGGVVIDLTSFVSGNRLTGYLTSAVLTDSVIAKLISGKYYINVHTAQNPDGEIRGQIYLETDKGFVAKLDGAQEAPPVTTNGYGLGVFQLSQNDSTLSVNIIVQNLSSTITSAHLHIASVGVSGPAIIDLTPFISGNRIIAIVNPATVLDSLTAGKVYVNVHTNNNPAGEVRGQLIHRKKLYFDATLNGAQEVPPVTTTAAGVASVVLTAIMDTLHYNVVADGLSGAITGAHFHRAVAGQDGGIVIDLTSNISGNKIEGHVTGSALTDSLIMQLLSGELYINVHTAANPNGEIRGQVYRLAREGYTFELNGLNEVPAVSTSAEGSALVSIDRNQTNVHFALVANDLSSTFAGAHFHSAIEGETGPVIFDMGSNIVLMGSSVHANSYWTGNDTNAFNLSDARQFRTDSIYLNVHTSNNPDGEIRGQVTRRTECFDITTSLIALESVNEITLMPNPATDKLTIKSASENLKELVIYDVVGRVVHSGKFNNSTETSIDVSLLNNGIYYIKIVTTEKEVTIRFVKN